MPQARQLATLALALSLALSTRAQTTIYQDTPENDPANLAGERVSPQDPADTLPINHGALALEQLLRKLKTRASLMLIVAHPDDEDGGMLTYYSRGQGARVAMLTLNRGEGGQNLMSADFNDALGLIRTQELLAADRYMGVDQFFGTEVDFGFSKTKEEAFAKWGHDRVLYDAVRCVRLYRPLVIASVFIGGPSDGHGQHQVSGEIAQEVFKAAGDPRVFPEMGLPPWQPLKVYARIPFARIDDHGMYDYATNQYVPVRFHNYVTGRDTTTVPKANVVIPEGTPDKLLDGKTYVQWARMGLALQKSQIGNTFRPAPAGEFNVSYHRYGSCLTPNSGCPIHRDSAMSGSSALSGVEGRTAPAQAEPAPEFEGTESSFFEGIDTSLEGIADLAPDATPTFSIVLKGNLSGLHNSLNNAAADFTQEHPEAAANRLKEALIIIDGLLKETEKTSLPAEQKFNLLHELHVKRIQLNDALVLSLGLSIQASAVASDLPAGVKTSAQVTLSTKEPVNYARGWSANDAGEGLGPGTGTVTSSLITSHRVEKDCALTDDQVRVSRPYFVRSNDIEQPFYDLYIPSLRDAPATPPALTCWVEAEFQGVTVNLGAIAYHDGQPLSFVDPISVSLSTYIKVLPADDSTFSISATAHSIGGKKPSEITLRIPDGWRSSPPYGAPEGVTAFRVSTGVRRFSTSPAVTVPQPSLTASIHYVIGDIGVAESYRSVGYPGLIRTNFFTHSRARIVPVDVHTAPNLRVAYLQGTGDNVPDYLPDLGITPTILTVADLTPAKLSQFDTVILGVRAYAAHPELTGAPSKALVDFAAAGGTVIVQYNNGHYTADDAPFPLTVAMSSTDHAHDVVDEAQPVVVLEPHATVLNWPNRITAADFDHWVEERGHGFAGTWAPEYQAPLETHDPGQEPQKGGLLVARVGKGYYVYCGYALYRQLPEGVPGAYRLFANLLSLPKSPTP